MNRNETHGRKRVGVPEERKEGKKICFAGRLPLFKLPSFIQVLVSQAGLEYNPFFSFLLNKQGESAGASVLAALR